MFQNSNRSAPQRQNLAARRAEVERLSKEYGLEAFLNPVAVGKSTEPTNPFMPLPAATPSAAQQPVVVVVKRRRNVAIPA